MLQFPHFSTSHSFNDLHFSTLHLLPDFKFLLFYLIPPFFAYSLLICNFINTLCCIFLFFLLLFSCPPYIFPCTFVSYLFVYFPTLTFFISCSKYILLLTSSPDSVFSSSLPLVTVYSCKTYIHLQLSLYTSCTHTGGSVEFRASLLFNLSTSWK